MTIIGIEESSIHITESNPPTKYVSWRPTYGKFRWVHTLFLTLLRMFFNLIYQHEPVIQVTDQWYSVIIAFYWDLEGLSSIIRQLLAYCTNSMSLVSDSSDIIPTLERGREVAKHRIVSERGKSREKTQFSGENRAKKG